MTETANKTAKHTPGPWTLINTLGQLDVFSRRSLGGIETPPNDGFQVADAFTMNAVEIDGDEFDLSHAERVANGKLIAAAPDLLATLEAVRRDHQLNGVECCCKPGVAAKCIVCTVEAAISKAVPNG